MLGLPLNLYEETQGLQNLGAVSYTNSVYDTLLPSFEDDITQDSELYLSHSSADTLYSDSGEISLGNLIDVLENTTSLTTDVTSTVTPTISLSSSDAENNTADELTAEYHGNGCDCGCNFVGPDVGTNNDGDVLSGTGGGSTSSGKPLATPTEFANYLTDGFWTDVGSIARSWSQTNLTYSLSNEFSSVQKTGLRMAFDMWQDVTNLTFTEVGSGANMTVVEGDDGRAYSSSSVNGSGTILSNTISIDTNQSFWSNFNSIGDYAVITAIHEIGHSLGLGHSGNYNGSANYTNDATWANDTRQYSVMSYFSASFSGADHSDQAGTQYGSTPLLYDIVAIQNKYGANTSTRSGNTTYGFNSNAGREQFDFTQTDDPVITIWDGGGTDTLDLSGYSVTQTIRLGEGEFSDVGGMTSNVSIAFGTTIENATGGSGNDTFYGNDSNNILLGGGGNDTFHGGLGDDTINGQTGDDTVNYSYSTADFTFNFIDSITVALTHVAQAFTDTLSNIENFIFTDVTHTFQTLMDTFGGSQTNDNAPVVATNDISLEVGESVLASTTISASDADGNDLTYIVWDAGKGSNSGYFELSGQALTSGTSHTLTSAEFASLNIIGGASAGTENFWVKVSDGTFSTSWSSFALTTTPTGGANDYAPTLSASNTSIQTNASILASSVITAADADGNTLTYTVWDSGSGSSSGYFELNGQALSAGSGHTLTAAEFASLNIVGGSSEGAETLWIKVSDGAHTTSWSSFSLTTTTGSGGGGGGSGGGANDYAPTVSATDLSLQSGNSVLASSIITAADADGNTLTYTVWDSGSSSSSGYFELNGQALSAGTGHVLTEAEFTSLNIVGGSSQLTDKLWVRVSDGVHTTAWDSFYLTTTTSGGGGGGGGNTNDYSPTVNATDLSLQSGNSVLASSIITAADADGNTLTYTVWDAGKTNGSGYFELSGQELASGQGHTLTEAEFASLNIVGGSNIATETLWVRVSDGVNKTAWESFSLTSTSNMLPLSMTADDILDFGSDEQDALSMLGEGNNEGNTLQSTDTSQNLSDSLLYSSETLDDMSNLATTNELL